MSRILYEKNTPTSFEEALHFDSEHPYYISIKRFLESDYAPLHYSSNSIELILGHNLTGSILIDHSTFKLQGDQIVVVFPGQVHSINIQPNDGHMLLLRLSKVYFDSFSISSALANDGISINQENLPCVITDAVCIDSIKKCLESMHAHDDNLFECSRNLYQLFETLTQYVKDHPSSSINSGLATPSIKSLVRWSIQNYSNDITVEMAAKTVGFSKNYFCAWFKALPGQSYMQYINDLRLWKASDLLRHGHPVGEVAASVGIHDLSYFIKQFKNKYGSTPLQYSKRYKS